MTCTGMCRNGAKTGARFGFPGGIAVNPQVPARLWERLTTHLPHSDRLNRVNKHDDVQR